MHKAMVKEVGKMKEKVFRTQRLMGQRMYETEEEGAQEVQRLEER